MKVLPLIALLGTLCIVVKGYEVKSPSTDSSSKQETNETVSSEQELLISSSEKNIKEDDELQNEVERGQAKKKVKGPSKKTASKILPLLLIPLMIQSQLLPIILFKLKMMAVKAMVVGKLALLILALNLIRNAIIGADNIDEQYEQQTLAANHYGYNGAPEYGSWIN